MKYQNVMVDATADLYVCTTAEDIDNGIPFDCQNCAIALAIKRAVGSLDAAVEIYPSVAYIEMPIDRETLNVNRPRLEKLGVSLKVGDWVLHRFHVNRTLHDQISSFDHTVNQAIGAYRFRKIRQSQRLGSNRTGSYNGKRPELSKPRRPWARGRGPFSRGMLPTKTTVKT